MGLGVECRSCVRASATAVARLSPGLATKAVYTVFFRMYASAECAQSASEFESAYREAVRMTGPIEAVLEPIPPRPAGPQLVRLGASAA